MDDKVRQWILNEKNKTAYSSWGAVYGMAFNKACDCNMKLLESDNESDNVTPSKELILKFLELAILTKIEIEEKIEKEGREITSNDLQI